MFKFPRNFDELLNASFTKKCLIKQVNLYSNLSLFCFLVTRFIITCRSFEIVARPRLLVWKFQCCKNRNKDCPTAFLCS